MNKGVRVKGQNKSLKSDTTSKLEQKTIGYRASDLAIKTESI